VFAQFDLLTSSSSSVNLSSKACKSAVAPLKTAWKFGLIFKVQVLFSHTYYKKADFHKREEKQAKKQKGSLKKRKKPERRKSQNPRKPPFPAQSWAAFAGG